MGKQFGQCPHSLNSTRVINGQTIANILGVEQGVATEDDGFASAGEIQNESFQLTQGVRFQAKEWLVEQHEVRAFEKDLGQSGSAQKGWGSWHRAGGKTNGERVEEVSQEALRAGRFSFRTEAKGLGEVADSTLYFRTPWRTAKHADFAGGRDKAASQQLEGVDLPESLEPSRPKVSPRRTSRLAATKAWTSWKSSKNLPTACREATTSGCVAERGLAGLLSDGFISWPLQAPGSRPHQREASGEIHEDKSFVMPDNLAEHGMGGQEQKPATRMGNDGGQPEFGDMPQKKKSGAAA